MKTAATWITGLLMLILGTTSLAEATLMSDKSVIRFISVKNASVAEVHHFDGLSGTIDKQGLVTVSIPLTAVQTNIPIRNERMREMFFEVASFATANIEANVDIAALKAMNNGDYTTLKVFFELNLHGQTQMLQSTVGVARLGDEFHVGTLAPLVINVASFELTEGVERLREVAGLKNIATAVPVTANFVFKL